MDNNHIWDTSKPIDINDLEENKVYFFDCHNGNKHIFLKLNDRSMKTNYLTCDYFSHHNLNSDWIYYEVSPSVEKWLKKCVKNNKVTRYEEPKTNLKLYKLL